MSQPRIPSVERGCVGKVNLGRKYKQQAEKFAAEYRTRFGVYRCPHCQAYHLTRKVENAEEYFEAFVRPLAVFAGLCPYLFPVQTLCDRLRPFLGLLRASQSFSCDFESFLV
jgi:hypothetical protein